MMCKQFSMSRPDLLAAHKILKTCSISLRVSFGGTSPVLLLPRLSLQFFGMRTNYILLLTPKTGDTKHEGTCCPWFCIESGLVCPFESKDNQYLSLRVAPRVRSLSGPPPYDKCCP